MPWSSLFLELNFVLVLSYFLLFERLKMPVQLRSWAGALSPFCICQVSLLRWTGFTEMNYFCVINHPYPISWDKVIENYGF